MLSRAVVLCLACLILAPCRSPATAAELLVEPVTVPELKAVFGRVESTRVVPARTRLGGTAGGIRVGAGHLVSEGQLIAIVFDDQRARELHAAEARLEALTAQLDNARPDLDRAQQLLARGVATHARVDEARMQ